MEEKNKKYDPRRNRQQPPREDAPPSAVGGRNAVRELLASGRDIDKILVAAGEREGSILVLIGYRYKSIADNHTNNSEDNRVDK